MGSPNSFHFSLVQSILALHVLQYWRDFFVAAENYNYTFAVIPKNVNNSFFSKTEAGCTDQADALTDDRINIICIFTGPSNPSKSNFEQGDEQAQIIYDLVNNRSVDGIAVSVVDEEKVAPAINHAVAENIPVLTFDSDASESNRTAYIGSDNHFFGQQLAKVLKQLVPDGGKYAVIGDETPNLQERVRGFEEEIQNMELSKAHWEQLQGSPANITVNRTGIDLMNEFSLKDPIAIVPVMGRVMRRNEELWEDFVTENRNITLVCGDAMENQLDLMARKKVDGLVGQLPYEMGSLSIQKLYDIVVEGKNITEKTDIFGTNVLSHLEIPLVLPPYTIDQNLIGNLRFFGFALYGLSACSALGFMLWTIAKRNERVVKVAQPAFLIMIAVGIFVMSCAIIPLSFDDGGNEDDLSEGQKKATCMSTQWLFFCGFTIAFSALFGKTLRINKIVSAQAHFTRVQVSVIDVSVPFFVLLAANIIVLTCWTIFDPLTYVREPLDGTDNWNRVIAEYGSCKSNHGIRYLLPLGLINAAVLVIANWQAYKARHVEDEFSEAKYIGLAMFSLLQAFLSGLPILFIVKETPKAYYLVTTIMIFVISMSVLLFIFIPKILLAHKFGLFSTTEQDRLIMDSIKASAKHARETQSRESQSRDISMEVKPNLVAHGELQNKLLETSTQLQTIESGQTLLPSDENIVPGNPTKQQSMQSGEKNQDASTLSCDDEVDKNFDVSSSEETDCMQKEAQSKSVCNGLEQDMDKSGYL